jgi:ribosomal protein L16 Arg81 hydroxylase
MAITADWQEWVALNLILQNEPNGMITAMVNAGVPQSDAQEAVHAASNHPYIKAALSMGRRLKKQDWLFDALRKLSELSPKVTEIQRVSKPTPEEFLEDYYSTNRPVVLTDCTSQWKALEAWTPEYLKKNFGEIQIALQGKRESNPDYEIDDRKHRYTQTVAEFVDMLQAVEKSNDFYMTANNTEQNRQLLQALQPDIQPMMPYLTPDDDNANGFFWFGPAGTITPVHHDLTNNFMAQVRGRKRVRMINASQLPLLYNHIHCYSQVDLNNIDYDRYPLFKEASIMDVTLSPGEVLFIPIGWWHHVTALDVSITMSFVNFIYPNRFTQKYTTYNAI